MELLKILSLLGKGWQTKLQLAKPTKEPLQPQAKSKPPRIANEKMEGKKKTAPSG